MTANLIRRMIFVIALLVIIWIAQKIGKLTLEFHSLKIVILPMVIAALITMLLAIPPLRRKLVLLKLIYHPEHIEFCGRYTLLLLLPLLARMSIYVGPYVSQVLHDSLGFLLSELGGVGTVIFGMPLALLLGLKRSSIGACLGVGREGELGFISEKFTLNSAEGQGVLAVYLIGTLLGALIFSVLIPILAVFGFSPLALAMASGVGSASMMTAAASSVSALYPQQSAQIFAYAALSNQVVAVLGTYLMLFINYPLCEWIYARYNRLRGSN